MFTTQGQRVYFDEDYIEMLYEMFEDDLERVRKYQAALFPLMSCSSMMQGRGGPAFGDIEGELLYLFIRTRVPQVLVEIGSGSGWSTSWALHGLMDNNAGMLYSYDIKDTAVKNLPGLLAGSGHWAFEERDIFSCPIELDDNIAYHNVDLLVIDAEHTDVFAMWYISQYFPLVKEWGIVFVHDMFTDGGELNKEGGEAERVKRWSDGHKENYRISVVECQDRLNKIRESVGITKNIHPEGSPGAFFLLKEVVPRPRMKRITF